MAENISLLMLTYNALSHAVFEGPVMRPSGKRQWMERRESARDQIISQRVIGRGEHRQPQQDPDKSARVEPGHRSPLRKMGGPGGGAAPRRPASPFLRSKERGRCP